MNDDVRSSEQLRGLPRALAIVLVLGFATVAILSFVHPFIVNKKPIKVSAYQKALSQSGATKDTTILVQPSSRDDVVRALTREHKNVRLALSLRYQEKPRTQVIVLNDKRSPLSKTLKSLVKNKKRVGEVDVLTLDVSNITPTLDADIARAKVEVVRKDKSVVKCRFNTAKQKHICPGLPEWMHVGTRELESGGKTKVCLWAHPISEGIVRVRFAPTTLGESLKLTHGLKTRVARNGSPVDAEIFVDEQSIGKATCAARPGFQSKTMRLKKSEKERRVKVEIKTKNDGARHYCFSVEAPRDETP